jgi:acetylornithine deacetylase/succinyl-diaminopimelate desuccinylase-like protein
MRWVAACLLLACPAVALDEHAPLAGRAREYLIDLLRLDTTNPPGNETRAAEYLKRVAYSHGIHAELLGPDPSRLNFIARLKGQGGGRALLLMAHTDVVPADRQQWSVDPFAAEVRDGYIYGRGAVDDKSLLAAELAIVVELKHSAAPLKRDIILLAEADEEAGSAGIQWLVEQARSKIDAAVALNEAGDSFETPSGERVCAIQTAEKIPTRVVLTAHGTAGHGSLPRPDNAIVRLTRAISRLVDADQPVRLNATTRRYFRDMARLVDYAWLRPYLARLENPATATAAANHIRARDMELDAMLRTTVAPTMLQAGLKVNVIPNTAVAHCDVRRLPDETREEVLSRLRSIVNDPAVEIALAQGQQMPATAPSSLSTTAYRTMERILKTRRGAVVLPYMSRGATDGSFLRAAGMNVYGVPVFLREGPDSRAHGNDERISIRNFEDGVDLLWRIVADLAGREE